MAFRTDRRKGDLLYLFDMSRGVEVLRLKKGAHAVAEDEVGRRAAGEERAFAAKPVGGLEAAR